jgi:DNA polymerase-3 subunit chi
MLPIRVDFYLLESNQNQARWFLACRLLEKAYARGHKVFVYCNNQHEAELMDELLWTFKEDSFIPHNLQGEGPEPPPPIQIGYASEPRGFDDILINLSNHVPHFYIKFKRVMELIINSEPEKEQGRANYKHYKTNQCALQTHPVK